MSNLTKLEYSVPTSAAKPDPLPCKPLASLQRATKFDPENKDMRQALRRFCEETWEPDFKKAIHSGNPPVYHDCCCAFSRRTFCRHAGHPPLQSSSVMKIPAFKEMQDHKALYTWLLKTLQGNKRRGERCLFPRFNIVHNEDDPVDTEDKDMAIALLNKRIEELIKLNAQQEQTIKKLRTETDQLLHSSKSWYQKYQELLEHPEKTGYSAFNTPMKRTNNQGFCLLDGDYY